MALILKKVSDQTKVNKLIMRIADPKLDATKTIIMSNTALWGNFEAAKNLFVAQIAQIRRSDLNSRNISMCASNTTDHQQHGGRGRGGRGSGTCGRGRGRGYNRSGRYYQYNQYNIYDRTGKNQQQSQANKYENYIPRDKWSNMTSSERFSVH